MRGDRHFCEIPVYRCREEHFNSRYARDLNTHMEKFVASTGFPKEKIPRGTMVAIEDSFWKRYVAPWRYNQVVGWVRLFVAGPQIRGDLWLCSSKRYGRRMRGKHIHLIGKAFELHCWPEQSSEDIGQMVRKELDRCLGDPRNGRLTLDFECFDNISPAINWRRLVFGDTSPV